MERFTRKLFFWTLVVLFFIAAPTVILRALGYHFDIHRGVFIHSGTITFKSNPQDVLVLLNGQPGIQPRRINNSSNINGLSPGDYEIKISQEGFNSWSKKTDVHSGVSSEFWNVLLTRKDYEKTDYPSDNTEGFFISPKNRLLALSQKNDSGLIVALLDVVSKELTQNFPFENWKIANEERGENIEWSPSEDYLSVPVEKISEEGEKKFHYFIIDPGNQKSFDLNDFIQKENIRDVRWDPKDKDYLFFLDGQSLFRQSVIENSDLVLISENVFAYDLSKDTLYYVSSPENLVFKSSLDGSGKNQLTATFPDTSTSVKKLIIYDDTRIGFIDSNKNIYVYNQAARDTYFKKLGSAAEGLHFSDDGKKILFWSGNEIWVYFTRDWDVQPIRKENDFFSITRYSENLRNVQWLKDYEHVIFSTGRFTKVIELDGRDKRNCLDIINTNLKKPFVRYSNSLERMYFTDEENGKMILKSIEFPEPTPILGIVG